MKAHPHQPIFHQYGSQVTPVAPQVIPTQQGSMRCPSHPAEVAKRICTSLGCNKRVLLCSECVYEDPDHVKLHKDLIMPISDYLQQLDNKFKSRVAASRNSARPYQDLPPIIKDLAVNDEQYVQNLQTFLNAERRKIANDLATFYQVFEDELEACKHTIQAELDHHYNHITQALVEFKRAIDPNLQQQDNPRAQVEHILRTQQDFNVLQAQLRSIRDRAFNQATASPLETPQSIQKCAHLADRIKKSVMHPPRYTPMAPNVLHDFAGKLKSLVAAISGTLIESISVPPTEDDISSADVFTNYAISNDALSVKLPIKERLVLSHQPTILPTFHKERITCIKALETPYLVSGGMDALAMMWNLDNGELVTTFQGHKGPITCLGSFKTASQNYLVSGSTDKNVILWDLDDESNTLVFKGHEDTVTTTISFEDEQHVASGGADRKIIVWDISNGKINCVLPCNGSIYKLHKLKQGGGKNYFFSCDHSQALNIFKIEYAQRNRSISIALEKVILTPCYIYGLTSSLTNPLMVLGSASDKTVKVWNFNYNREEGKFQNEAIVKEFQGHKGGVAETIIVDTNNSSPGHEDYFVVSCGLNDERIIVKHCKSQQAQYYSHAGLKINEPFTSHKMQVTRNSKNEYKLVVVNQSPGTQQLLLWELEDTRIL